MENEDKIKVCLKKMLNTFRFGFGNEDRGDISFFNPLLAGMEIESIGHELDKLVRLLGYKRSLSANTIELTKIN